jgi:hypothetical protein
VPSVTELLYELGLTEQLVGRTGFCVHPWETVRSIPKVGGTKDVKLDRIRALACGDDPLGHAGGGQLLGRDQVKMLARDPHGGAMGVGKVVNVVQGSDPRKKPTPRVGKVPATGGASTILTFST